MIIRTERQIPSSEITDEYLYQNRRQFLKAGSLALAGVAGSSLLSGCAGSVSAESQGSAPKKSPFDATETPTPYQAITTYNNFYEFGVDKDQPAKRSGTLKTSPWSINVEGLVKKPATYALEDLLKGLTPED